MYRSEHPKPQFMRDNWVNLNGKWQFEIDNAVSGEARKLYDGTHLFPLEINVPFCPESKLSGIENVDFMNAVWYKRTFSLSAEQLENLVFLHFGAVDYEANIYVNGKKCCNHKGGYVSFSCDITEQVKEGENTLIVQAIDDTRCRLVPTGKQARKYESYACYYTRTTGIWQTVWLEFVPRTHIEKVKYTTDINQPSLFLTAYLCGKGTFTAKAYYEGKLMGSAEIQSNGGMENVTISLAEKHLWEVGCGRLYDLELTYGQDKVKSYFGLRSLQLDGHKFLINGKSVFQRLILDQGFYPDGIYTAPDDSELIADIDRALAMGFNGARLHEKVFEERFLYHCDRKGYIVWGEYPNWGLDHTYKDAIYGIIPEWLEEIDRDFNHPAIVGWCPFNETWDRGGRKQYDDLLALTYKITKAADPTRPCIDTSGNYHVLTDIYDLHDYAQDPKVFAENYAPLGNTNQFDFREAFVDRQVNYDGKMPFFVSEYGGIGWNEDENSWGYGNSPKSPEEYLDRLKKLTDVLLDNKYMFGLCYTQLTDVEQEQNGLYYYNREPKFDPKLIYEIFSRKAAIED